MARDAGKVQTIRVPNQVTQLGRPAEAPARTLRPCRKDASTGFHRSNFKAQRRSGLAVDRRTCEKISGKNRAWAESRNRSVVLSRAPDGNGNTIKPELMDRFPQGLLS